MITDISGWIARWGGWTPEKVAVRFEGREVSYAELERDVGSTAGWLRDNGVSPGDRVGYLGPNCPELLELLLACARLGAIFVPFNARMPPAELRVFVDATRPRLLVTEHGWRAIALESSQDLESESVKTFRPGDEFARAWGASESAPAVSGVEAAAPVLVLFTSGTTGPPKGATFTHVNLAFNALNVLTAFGVTATDEILIAVPMFHSGGLLIHTLPGLCAGATVTIHRQFDPGELLEEVQRQRITLLPCVPAVTFALAAHPAWVTTDLSSLRCVVTGSTVVPKKAIEPWQQKGVPVSQGYGMTETCVIATTMPPGSPSETAFTAGRPVISTQIRVVDQTGRDVAIEEPGEVWFRGPAVVQGYWDNEQATREAFCDGWLRSGDIGLIDEDGYLHIVDRLKDIIIVGSSNVYPRDLEVVLDACADIHDAAVVGMPDEQLGEVPIACVVPVRGRAITPQQVIELFDNRVAAYKHPRDVIFFDELPRTATDKVDRKRLYDIVTAAPQRTSARSC